jgi:putative NADH-flavin reductase
MSLGLNQSELQRSFETQTDKFKVQGGWKNTETLENLKIEMKAYAVAILATIEANNHQIERQLRAKGIDI